MPNTKYFNVFFIKVGIVKKNLAPFNVKVNSKHAILNVSLNWEPKTNFNSLNQFLTMVRHEKPNLIGYQIGLTQYNKTGYV